MPEIIEVFRLAVRLEDGTVIDLPGYNYAYDFSGNFAVVGKNNSEGAINEKGEEIIPVKYYNLAKLLFGYYKIEKYISDKDIAIVLGKDGYEAINLVTREKFFICNKDVPLPEGFF